MIKKLTKSDLSFKRYKNNEKGGQQDQKLMRKLLQNTSKWSNERFWLNIKPPLSQIISGTKWDGDKPFFLQKEVVNKIDLGIKRDPMVSENAKNRCQSWGNSLPPSSMGVHRPLGYIDMVTMTKVKL